MAEEDITFEDANWLHLRATQRVSRAFSELNLFIAPHREAPVNPNFIIRIPKWARFENFTSSRGLLYSAGAFTFSENNVTDGDHRPLLLDRKQFFGHGRTASD